MLSVHYNIVNLLEVKYLQSSGQRETKFLLKLIKRSFFLFQDSNIASHALLIAAFIKIFEIYKIHMASSNFS